MSPIQRTPGWWIARDEQKRELVCAPLLSLDDELRGQGYDPANVSIEFVPEADDDMLGGSNSSRLDRSPNRLAKTRFHAAWQGTQEFR